MRLWKRENKDKVNRYNLSWKSKNRPKSREINKFSLRRRRYEFYEKTLWYYAKRGSARKRLPFNLEVSDIVIPEFCPVLGIKLDTPKMGKKRPDGKPSIDRVDNSKGYVKGNVIVVSWRANRLKCDASIGELEAIVAYMKQHTTVP